MYICILVYLRHKNDERKTVECLLFIWKVLYFIGDGIEITFDEFKPIFGCLQSEFILMCTTNGFLSGFERFSVKHFRFFENEWFYIKDRLRIILKFVAVLSSTNNSL